jgi:hypothetical protein
MKGYFRKWAENFIHLDSHENTAERRNFFLRKNRVFSIKSPNSSKKSTKKFENHEISTLYYLRS